MSPHGVAAGVAAVTLTLLTSVLVGCASTDREASDRASEGLERAVPSTTPPTTAGTPPPCDARKSYRPAGPPPPPGAMPAGSTMAAIVATPGRRLRIAVDETTKYWSSANPENGRLEGFEVALGYAIARALFGDLPQAELEQRVEFVTVTTEDKFEVVEDGDADMTISVASMGCDRWVRVDFSSPYYEAFQQLVVPFGSPITGQDVLYGKRVCVTKTASGMSSSGKLLDALNKAATGPEITIVEKFSRLPCLIKLQEGKVDAIVLPNSIVFGLVENDPTMEAKPTVLHDPEGKPATSAYGIVINQKERDLTRFVNSLLDQWRGDGTLQRLMEGNLPEAQWRPPPLPLEYRD